MIKFYSKKHLAKLIIKENPDIFIPYEELVDDLDKIYKIRKIAKKILTNRPFDVIYLTNLIKMTINVFGDNTYILYKIILSPEELEIIAQTIEKDSGFSRTNVKS